MSEQDVKRSEFYEAALQPGFPDRMAFMAARPNPDPQGDDVSFSKEAVEDLAYQVHDYVMASILRRWRTTGKAPKRLRLNVDLNWGDTRGPRELQREEDYPWYHVEDVGTNFLPADGSVRLDEFLKREE